MATDAKNPEHWFDFASDDLIRAHRRFVEGDAEDCLFHLQQSAEKALKGKLIACGWKLRRIHDLSALIVALKTFGVDCSWYESSASVLATEYITDRYPGFDDAHPQPSELRTFVEETTTLFETLTGRTYRDPQMP